MRVGRLPWALAFGCSLWSVSTERSLCAGSRAAEPVDQRATGASPPLAAFAVPHKRRRLFIPASCRLLKPAPDLLRAVRVLSIQRAALEHALDRLRHVEPAAADGRVERHDAMRAQPQHQVGRLVAGKIVPHQQKPQGRQILRQREGPRQPRLPNLPGRLRCCSVAGSRNGGQLRQDLVQALAQPRMQHRIGAAGGWLEPHLARSRMKQGQDLGCAAAHVFVRLARRSSARLP